VCIVHTFVHNIWHDALPLQVDLILYVGGDGTIFEGMQASEECACFSVKAGFVVTPGM
jgi:predicted polyphosphate/ATP-dependent NAD kinase